MSQISFDQEYDAVVIGAGIGGLACGAILAKGAKRVKVIEQYARPGGYCDSFKRKGFNFSAAVLRINGCEPGGIIERLVSTLGLQDEIEFYPLDPMYQVIFPGESFLQPRDMNQYIAMLSARFPREREGIIQLFDTMKSLYQERLSSPGPALQKYQDKTFRELVDEHIRDRKLKSFISFNWDGASPPSKVSAVYNSRMIIGHFTQGNFWPKGGPEALTNVLVRGLKKFGGELELKTKVTRIIVEEDKAIGVETEGGEKIKASHVISNAAGRQTYLDLVGEEKLKPDFIMRLEKMNIGISAFVVYLGVDLDPRAVGITAHDVMVHETFDLDKAFDTIYQGNFPPPFCELGIPTLVDPSLAPENKHIIIIITYAPYHLKGKNWKEEKARLTEEAINKAERVIPDLSQHIVVKDSATPLTLERYTLNTEGAVLGWEFTPEGYLNRLRRKGPIENLYLAGQWTTAGAGIPPVAAGGLSVAQMIMAQ